MRFRKVRNLPGREPRFWLQHWDENAGWLKGAAGADTSILYRIDEIADAFEQGRVITVVEGEKDADNLWNLDIPATCNTHGVSEPEKKPKWTAKHSEQLRGADFVILNDNDAAGYAHADAVGKLSRNVAKRVRRLDLKNDWPEIPKGGDVSDWLAIGGEHTAERLKALIEAATDFADSTEALDQAASSSDDDAELERLARLPPLEYARARKEAAERLSCGCSPSSTPPSKPDAVNSGLAPKRTASKGIRSNILSRSRGTKGSMALYCSMKSSPPLSAS